MADFEFNSVNEEPHELMLRDYLSDRLDGQLGGAEARFRQFLAQDRPGAAPRNPWQIHNRFRGWTFGVVGAALAASLAALWAGPSLQPVAPQGPNVVAPAHEPTLVS